MNLLSLAGERGEPQIYSTLSFLLENIHHITPHLVEITLGIYEQSSKDIQQQLLYLFPLIQAKKFTSLHIQ
jgi:hypothetical protein